MVLNVGRLVHDCPRQEWMDERVGVGEGGRICMDRVDSCIWVVRSFLEEVRLEFLPNR